MSVALALAMGLAASTSVADEPSAARSPERVALLPPVEFNLEENLFAAEPIADADPEPVPELRHRRRSSGGRTTPGRSQRPIFRS
jgi:hypothetical protein